jgi:hypothetical protein
MLTYAARSVAADALLLLGATYAGVC